MEEEQKEKRSSLVTIVGMCALVGLLMLGATGIFAALERMGEGAKAAAVWHAMLDPNGSNTSYEMRPLDAEERDADDIRRWLDSAQAWADSGSADRTNNAFWLYRQETDDYILYLPGQDRALAADGFTAAEETDGDGGLSLVLRARTPEGAAQVVPEEQLFAMRTTSQQWNGIRVRVVLDGREPHVNKMTWRSGQLFSADEMYIGRDRMR